MQKYNQQKYNFTTNILNSFFNTTNVEQVIEQFIEKFKNPLPGHTVQQKMSAYYKTLYNYDDAMGFNPKIGAVMVLLMNNDNETSLVYMKRPMYDGIHGGQISFFGGKKENQDANLIETALREAREEGGFDIDQLKFIGALTPLYVQASNYLISPFVFYSSNKIHFSPDIKEVERIIEVDINLIEKSKSNTIIKRNEEFQFEAPCYQYNQDVIWGATAMITIELEEILFK